MPTQPNVTVPVFAPAGRHPHDDGRANDGRWARELSARVPHLTRRFLTIRPELAREDGRWGVALALAWLARCADAGLPWEACQGGELFWDHLAGLSLPPHHDPAVVADAAVGFVGFLGSVSVLPAAAAARLRQQARVEGLAYVAHTMGLLSQAEAEARKRRFRRQ